MAEDLARLRAFLLRAHVPPLAGQPHAAARRAASWPRCSHLFLRRAGRAAERVVRARLRGRDEAGRARVVCDYIAGMTDRYAIEEHRKLFQLEPWS